MTDYFRTAYCTSVRAADFLREAVTWRENGVAAKMGDTGLCRSKLRIQMGWTDKQRKMCATRPLTPRVQFGDGVGVR